MSSDTLTLKVEFGGGLELLFSNKRIRDVTIPAFVPGDSSVPSPESESIQPTSLKQADVTFLLHYLREKHLTDRPELFMEKDTVRPGILVLINDTDWELEGEGDYVLKDKDEIVLISTLHGG
ncbi:ubiquitin-related modifier 1 [Hygrophoropsis aurantiaca]|uniref:Ubiquitin-related modifier 1 n=1 Tax=Hygrophoropsis aurantiaca TaxID=72124 RepID=A0ACB8ASK3_9AGAM|nr:ubiquitin-related modifier 1 [Hygrophoropsis aurantiaca]